MRNKVTALKDRNGGDAEASTGGDVNKGAADTSCSCASIFNKRLKCEAGG